MSSKPIPAAVRSTPRLRLTYNGLLRECLARGRNHALADLVHRLVERALLKLLLDQLTTALACDCGNRLSSGNGTGKKSGTGTNA